MDETIETLLVGVRADTATFAGDAAQMQSSLQGALGQGADKAGSLIESGLAKGIRSGKLGFDDLEKSALAALDKIASQAVSSGLSALFGGSGSEGLVSVGTSLITSLFGLPGRATGGPVSPDRPYVVGERGPELFVPTAAGSIVPASPGTAAATGGTAPASPAAAAAAGSIAPASPATAAASGGIAPSYPATAAVVGGVVPSFPATAAAGGTTPAARTVNVAISIAAPAATEPQALARSGRQVARAVSRALAQAER